MSSRLARSAGLISIATLASRVLGVARDALLVWLFGASASPAMDAYNVAFRVPNIVRDLFAEGAMTAAFVPIFTRRLTTSGREAAWRVGNLVINALLVVTGALVVLGIVFAEPLTRAITRAEFAAVEGKLALTVQLTQIMLPFLTTIAVAVAMMGMLNSLHRFFVPALAPAMFNVVTIVCAFTVVPLMPSIGLDPIAGIAIATVLGGLGQIVLQWPALRKEGFRYRPILDFRDPDLRNILRLMGPGTLGLAAVQINVVVNLLLATGLPQQGTVTWLQTAFRLMYLPIGLFGVSIAMAAMPDLARQATDGDKSAMRQTISNGLRMMLMLNVPATIGLIALAQPIIELLFEYGKFTDFDTAGTAAALMFYAPGLVGYSAVKIASPSFYSLGDSRTPVVVSITSVGLNLGLNYFLVQVMGHRGLALGTALAAVFNAGALLVLLERRLNGLDTKRITIALIKVLAASSVMGWAAWFAVESLESLLPGSAWYWRAVRVFTSIGIGVVVLIAAGRVLRIHELTEALNRVFQRLVRR